MEPRAAIGAAQTKAEGGGECGWEGTKRGAGQEGGGTEQAGRTRGRWPWPAGPREEAEPEWGRFGGHTKDCAARLAARQSPGGGAQGIATPLPPRVQV